MIRALLRLFVFLKGAAPVGPFNAPGSMRITAVKQTLKNSRIDTTASVISHGLSNLCVALSGAPVLAGLLFVLSVGADTKIKSFANASLNRMRAVQDPDLLLFKAKENERTLISIMLFRCFLALASPLVLLLVGTQHETHLAAAALMIAASATVFVTQASPNPRVLILGTWPVWAGLAGFGFWLVFRFESTDVAVVVLAYFCCMLWFARYFAAGQAKLQRLLAGKDQHAEELARAFKRRERDVSMLNSLESDLPVGFFDYDAGQQTLFWSPGTYRAFGRLPGSQVPSLAEQLAQIPKEFRAQAKANINAYTNTPGVTKFVMPIVGLDGQIRQVSSIVHTVMDEGGKLAQIFGVVDDQTELRSLLLKAEQFENRLETALTSGCSMVWDLEEPGHKFVGFGAVEHFLRPDQDPNGDLAAFFNENVLEEDRQKVNHATRQAYLEKRPQMIDFRFCLDGETIRHGRSVVSVFGRPASGVGTVRSFVTDITEDVEQREALDQARAAAELANTAKSAFLANMSHEIRTPLNGIVAITGALAGTDLTPAQREMVDLVCDSGVSLERVLNDILDLARVESGRLEIEAAPFSLTDLISGTTALFSVKADDKGLQFNQSGHVTDGTWLIGDAVRIRQILTNFLSNAIKFTSQGGIDLCVDLKPVADANRQELTLSLSVKDTGPGIAPVDLERLFNRFEQIDASITRAHGGSGLGLAICKSLAHLMGGDVEAQSVLGQGSIFSLKLTLPIAENNAKDRQRAIGMDPDFVAQGGAPNLKILVADDHPTNRRVLQMILEPLGIELVMCEDGQKALDALEKGPVDLALMDLQMPVMDGLTAIQTIRQREIAQGKSRLPIIAVSANAMAHHKAEALDAGADMHIAKPFTPSTLLRGLEAVLAEGAINEVSAHKPASAG
jgi:signal transduction histidine kinase/ActR/RegA family two-component response regulator